MAVVPALPHVIILHRHASPRANCMCVFMSRWTARDGTIVLRYIRCISQSDAAPKICTLYAVCSCHSSAPVCGSDWPTLCRWRRYSWVSESVQTISPADLDRSGNENSCTRLDSNTENYSEVFFKIVPRHDTSNCVLLDSANVKSSHLAQCHPLNGISCSGNLPKGILNIFSCYTFLAFLKLFYNVILPNVKSSTVTKKHPMIF